MNTLISAVLLVVALFALTVWLALQLRQARSARDAAEKERQRLADTYRPILDAEAARDRILAEAASKSNQVRAEAASQRDRILAEAAAQRDQILLEATAQNNRLREAVETLRASAEREAADISARHGQSVAELTVLESRVQALRTELLALDEEANLESFGFYKPRYHFAESARYAGELDRIREEQKGMLKAKSAAVCPVEWTVGGSRAEGKKATNQTLKLMLRAFNGECDAAVAKVTYSNVNVMTARINKAFEVINSLAEVNQCRIVDRYRELKLNELFLAHEYEEKLQAEKEEQRRIKEQLRDEEIAQRQLEKARQDAEREELKYAEALEKARQEVALVEGAKQTRLAEKIAQLERRLAEAHTNKERAIAQAQLTRSGHVYVISNIGSFGEHVYKIGMTRRLDPKERIKELSDASVPFNFDIHAIIYSEDAPALEAELHRVFDRRRLNRVNERKEFFRVTIDEIAHAVLERKADVELTKLASAEEFRKTQAICEEEAAAGARIPISIAPGHHARPVVSA